MAASARHTSRSASVSGTRPAASDRTASRVRAAAVFAAMSALGLRLRLGALVAGAAGPVEGSGLLGLLRERQPLGLTLRREPVRLGEEHALPLHGLLDGRCGLLERRGLGGGPGGLAVVS